MSVMIISSERFVLRAFIFQNFYLDYGHLYSKLEILEICLKCVGKCNIRASEKNVFLILTDDFITVRI